MEQLKNQLKMKIISELKLVFNGSDFKANLDIKNKSDNSIVTKVDTIISHLVKEQLQAEIKFQKFTFYSEEDHDKLQFPAIILDPIDGTRELSQGLPECAVSLAIMYSSRIDDPKNWGWIFNPFTGFEIDSDQDFCPPLQVNTNFLIGMVSRSEWNRGLHTSSSEHLRIHPKGSIALKLGLLSAGAIDFVISKRPKNIWDIAAGSIICAKKNIITWQNDNGVKELNDKKIEPNLIWANAEVFKRLKEEKL